MDFLKSVEVAIKEAIGDDNRPVVVYSSMWPFLKEMKQNDLAAVEKLVDILLDVIGERSILMPTFTGGFVDGICDLDSENSSTGILTELFRKLPGVKRTLSAFFPFSVYGEAIDEVYNLKPMTAWGDGSLYEWMELRDVCFLLLGTQPTQCSYLHRFEWLARNKINYRFNKTFKGKLIRDGISQEVEETLYVRELSPPVVNDFTTLQPFLEKIGPKTASINGVSIASYHAQELLTNVFPVFQNDPLLTVKNRNDYENRND